MNPSVCVGDYPTSGPKSPGIGSRPSATPYRISGVEADEETDREGERESDREMSLAVSSNTQEEYEDDFEKDLDWLISEESKNEEQDEDDIESQIDHELEEELGKEQEEEQSKSATDDDGDNERWPTPMDPLEDMLDVSAESKHEQDEGEVNEEKKSIQQKIEQANRQLQDQEAPDEMRRRRLQFKDTLVDLVVPAGDLEDSPGDVSGHMLKLKISSQEESDGQRNGGREGRVLVEKDGKFDLVSLKEVESPGLLPPLPETQREPVKSPSPSMKLGSSSTSEPRYAPRPPERPRVRPSSASNTQRVVFRNGSKRRVQSASGVSSHATFSLSPQQKEQLNKRQQRREKLAREDEERRREEEEQKRQENELAFRSWLMKKRQQVREERRVQRAQEIERMNGKKECCDADEAFNLWLQKKKQQQLKEQQLEEMKRLEMESSSYLHQPEECAKAFRLWLRRKWIEKRQEQQAARERSRRLLMEERRARRMNVLCYPVDEIQSLRFNQPYSYSF